MKKCNHRYVELWEVGYSTLLPPSGSTAYLWRCTSCGRTTNVWRNARMAKENFKACKYQMDLKEYQDKWKLIRPLSEKKDIKKIPKEKLKKWAEKGLDLTCPFCGSGNTDSTNTNYCDNMYYKDMYCNDCKGEYYFEYERCSVGYKDEENNKVVWYPYDFKEEEKNRW